MPRRSAVRYRMGKRSSSGRGLCSCGLTTEWEKARCSEHTSATADIPCSSRGPQGQGQEEPSASPAQPGRQQQPPKHRSQRRFHISGFEELRKVQSSAGEKAFIRLALPGGAEACACLVFLCRKADKNPWIAPTLA